MSINSLFFLHDRVKYSFKVDIDLYITTKKFLFKRTAEMNVYQTHLNAAINIENYTLLNIGEQSPSHVQQPVYA